MNTQLRIGHFSPDAPAVNVIVDGSTVLETVSFGDISEYMDIEAGSRHVSITPAEGGDAVIEATMDVEAGTAYTVLAAGELADIEALVLADDFAGIDDAESLLRFVHLSPDAPAVDLRAEGGGTLFEGVEFGEAAALVPVEAGSYDVSVVPTGGTDPVLSLSDLSLEPGVAYTVFGIGTLAEDSLEALLVEDRMTDRARRKAATR